MAKKYYNVFAYLPSRPNYMFSKIGTYTSKKDAYRNARNYHGYVTKTVQDDPNNQGRIICQFTQGYKQEL